MHTTLKDSDAQRPGKDLGQPISSLPMEVEASRYLARIGVHTIQDLISLTEKDLQGLIQACLLQSEKPSKQKTALIRNKIKRCLESEGLSLAQN